MLRRSLFLFIGLLITLVFLGARPALAANNAAFVSQVVPTTLAAGQTSTVSITMQNTGTTTWTQAGHLGHKLGTQNPQDNTLWTGFARIYLAPEDSIEPWETKTFTFTIKAPASPGTYNFQWRMVQEGIEWFGAFTPNVVINVTPSSAVTLCPGVQIEFGDWFDDGPAIQQCINATPAGGTLQLPAGIYEIWTQVVINKSMTLRTLGTSGLPLSCEIINCATLQAQRAFNLNGSGFLVVRNASRVTIDHIVLDGNFGERTAYPPPPTPPFRFDTEAAYECRRGNSRWGFNASIHNCANCKFTYNVSKDALCGTGLEFSGHDATITNNIFRDNGQSSEKNMGADGLTVLYSDRALITNNTFIDNSGNALIVGGGRNAFIANNSIRQPYGLITAGLMLHRFGTSTPGDFTGAVVTQNRIDCGTARNCHFGIMLGPHPWDSTVQISGGTVHGNTVINARQGINVEGAGTIASPLTLYNNLVSGTPTSGAFACGTRQTSPLNIYTPHSVVNRNGDTTPATNWLWHGCP